jgi:hypothetical protein
MIARLLDWLANWLDRMLPLPEDDASGDGEGQP